MANSVQGIKRFQDAAHGGGMLAQERGAESVWRWLHPWRWPVALLAGIVLWLALIAVAGAAPLGVQSSTLVRGSQPRYHPFVINSCFMHNTAMPSSSR